MAQSSSFATNQQDGPLDRPKFMKLEEDDDWLAADEGEGVTTTKLFRSLDLIPELRNVVVYIMAFSDDKTVYM